MALFKRDIRKFNIFKTLRALGIAGLAGSSTNT